MVVDFDFSSSVGNSGTCVNLSCGQTTEISFTLPANAVKANDDSGPWMGLFNVDAAGKPTTLVTKDTWYRATVVRSPGFTWEGQYTISAPGKYAMALVPRGGSVQSPLSVVCVNGTSDPSSAVTSNPVGDGNWIDSIFGKGCELQTKFGNRSAQEFYKGGAQQAGMEIVYNSSDNDVKEYNEYYAEMPWAALKFRSADSDHVRRELSAQHKLIIKGIPTLLIFDGKTGKLITQSGRSEVQGDPDNAAKIVQTWLNKVS